VKKIIFMGIGEPAHNLGNVLEAIDLLGTEGNLGHKSVACRSILLRISISTPQSSSSIPAATTAKLDIKLSV